MKRNFLVGSVALAFVGISSAAAEDAPLIPDCYATNYSRSDFRDCVHRAGSTGDVEPAGRSPAAQTQQQSASASDLQDATDPDAPPPPEGMWERDHRRMSYDAPRDRYAGAPDPRESGDGPPSESEMDGSRSDVDGPQWGPPPDSDERDAGDRPGFGPPAADDDWRGSQGNPYEGGPPDDGPDADL